MCVWNLPVESRLCHYCNFPGVCERRVSQKEYVMPEKAKRYIDIMSDLLGENVLGNTRHRRPVWGRFMLSYQLMADGFSSTEVGKILGRDHTIVLYGRSQVRKMLESPRFFREETKIWYKFQKIISLQLCGTS